MSAVADFKAPVFEPGGSMQQGMYTPKGTVIGVILYSVVRCLTQGCLFVFFFKKINQANKN